MISSQNPATLEMKWRRKRIIFLTGWSCIDETHMTPTTKRFEVFSTDRSPPCFSYLDDGGCLFIFVLSGEALALVRRKKGMRYSTVGCRRMVCRRTARLEFYIKTSLPGRRCPGIRAPRWTFRRFAPLAGSAQLSRFAITQARDELSERLLFHCSSGVARAFALRATCTCMWRGLL